MYEEKTKRLNINFKSVAIKMAILLVVLFVALWIISIFRNKDSKIDFETNLGLMKDAASEYFTESKLPVTINGKKKVTLKEMYDEKLLVEFADEKTCSLEDSYAEATKINDTDYTVKVKLVCGDEVNYVINELKVKDSDNNDSNIDVDGNPDVDDLIINPDDSNDTDNNNENNVADNSKPNSSTTKPSSTTTNKTSTSTSKKPNSSTGSSTSSKPNTNSVASTCTYGNKDYNTSYPIAYLISGNCAVSKDDYYKATYVTAVNQIGINEYRKLVSEMTALANKEGVALVVKQPAYSAVYNKAGTGLVGYQIRFVVQQNMIYKYKTVYEYYIDQYGNRRVITDTRNSLQGGYLNSNSSSSSSSSSSVAVQSVSLNTSSVSLYTGNTYTLRATVNPSNATNKTVTWRSSNTNVASVSQSGVVTANNSGSATITASVGGKSASATIYVSNNTVQVTSLTLNRNTLDLYTGETYTLRATVNPSNATNKTVTWKSSNTNVVTVSSSGYIVAKKAGNAIITATAGGKSVSAFIYVSDRDLAVQSVNFDDSNLTLNVGDSYKLKYTVNPSGAIYNKKIVFTSTNKSVITLKDDVITAVGAGTSIIGISIDGKTDYMTVTVKDNKTYSYTYYLMNKISSSDVNKTYDQKLILNNLIYTAKIKSVKIDYFNSSDYNTFKTKNSINDVGVYSGRSLVSYKDFNYSDNYLKNSTLTSRNYTTKYEGISEYGNYYWLDMSITVNNVNNVTKYNNYYYVPLKITVTYSL